MAIKTEIMTQKASNSAYDATQNAGKLAKIVSNELMGNEWTINPDGADDAVIGEAISIIYTNETLKKDEVAEGKPAQNGKILFDIELEEQEAVLYIDGISISGKVSPTTGFGAVNKVYVEKFGKKVNEYKLKNGTVENGKWRVFYADSNSVYIIRDWASGGSLANYSWFDESEISKLGKNLNKKFTSWNLKSDGENLNNNIKGTATLLDTTKWENYKADYATWVIGAPTLELYIASFNATHTNQIGCKVESETSTGYRIIYNNPLVDNVSAMDKAIYCEKGSHVYWLASPSAENSEIMLGVSWNTPGFYGRLRYNWPNGYVHSRPLASVPLSKIDSEITITNEY